MPDTTPAIPSGTTILATAIGADPTAAPPVVPPAPPEAKPPENKADSRRFAVLARQASEHRKSVEADKAAIKAERDAIAAEKQAIADFNKARENAKLDPIAYLEAAGLTYEQATEYVLNGKKPTPDAQVQAVRDELGRFAKKQEDDRRTALEAEKKRIEEQDAADVRAFHAAAEGYVTSRPNDYELTLLHEGASLVPGLIESHHAKTGKILSYKEAADMVEAHLAEQIEKSIATTKFKSKYAPAAPVPAAVPPPTGTRPTLTNEVRATTPPPKAPGKRPPTDEERMARAMAVLNGTAAR